MNTTVRTYLIELARKRTNQTVTYQKLSDDCNLGLHMHENPYDRVVIGNLLGEISEYEHNHGRPLLSSLVIRLNDGEEGEGFYKLAERLGYGKVKKLKDNLFEHEQIAECIEFWTNSKNYISNKEI
jgi:hypothetical protein